MSAPAAKKPSSAEHTTITFTSPSRSAASIAACRPSRIGTPRALAGGRSIVTTRTPGLSSRQLTTSDIGLLPSSGHRQAAADRQRLPGDEAGTVGGEEGDGRTDVLGRAEPLHRHRPGHPGDHLLRVARPLRELAQGRCVGGARADRVRRDALGGHLAGQGLGEGDDAALRAGVHGLQRRAHPAGVRADVDHPAEAALGHPRRDRLDHPQRTLEVDVEDLVPELLGGLHERHEVVPAGVVHRDVDWAELGLDRPHGRLDGVGPGDVDLDRDRDAAGGGDLLGGLLGGGDVQVRDRDLEAGLSEGGRDALADSLGSSGDDGDSHAFSSDGDGYQCTGPATMEWLVSLRPSTDCAIRAASITASRSRPVPTPISWNMLTRSSVAMLPVEPAGTGQPPSSPKLDSKLVQPTSSAAYALASPCPRVLWKCAVTSIPGSRSSAVAKNFEAYAGLHMPVVSPNPISVAPACANCSARPRTRSSGTLPSYGQPNDVAITAQNVRSSATMRLPITFTSAIVSPTVRLMLRWLCVSDALTNSATSSNSSRTARALSRPRLFGTSTIRATPPGRSMPRSTSTPSDSCGITSGRTKLATSMRVNPARPKASISLILSWVAMVSGSFWKPSRGPTSRMRTLVTTRPPAPRGSVRAPLDDAAPRPRSGGGPGRRPCGRSAVQHRAR